MKIFLLIYHLYKSDYLISAATYCLLIVGWDWKQFIYLVIDIDAVNKGRIF